MKVIPQADGSCPSCGSRGELSLRSWQGEQIRTLIPNRDEPSTAHYGCLYLRPFASRVRARARMRAVARAMRPLGTTVAFHAGEARLGWFGPLGRSPIFRVIGFIPKVGPLVSVPLLLWNLSVLVIERLHQAAQRSIFRMNGVELVDSMDDRWKPTFRRLAYASRMIVMDISATSAGLAYEAEFLRDPGIARRLIFIHNGSMAGLRVADEIVMSLRSADPDLTVPVVHYSVWSLRRLTARLGELARSHFDCTQPLVR